MGRTSEITITGGISGKQIALPDENVAPMPEIAPPGPVLNGEPIEGFDAIDPTRAHPDVLSSRRKLGLLLPATNTTMERELWSLLCACPELEGVGLHTANVVTPRPKLGSADDLLAYKRQFLDGLGAAVDQILLAQPQYLIMGMSLEHILRGVEAVAAPLEDLARYAALAMTTCHAAAAAALERVGARRIGLLTPFDKLGNENAAQMYTDLGYEVAATAGFSCANTLHIAHVPDAAKERAIVEFLATSENRLDAVVQCGTNMSFASVSERLEPRIGIPLIGINAALLWHALRENGFDAPIDGAGALLREH